MGDSRAATLLGSYGLFAGLSLLVVARPEYGLYLFPAFAIPLLWSDLRRDAESPVILTFLATVAGMVLIGRASDTGVRLALGAGIAGLWTLAAARSPTSGRC